MVRVNIKNRDCHGCGKDLTNLEEILVVEEIVSRTPMHIPNIGFCEKDCLENTQGNFNIKFWFNQDEVEFEK